MTDTTKHITLYAITKGNAKNNEILSVCIVLISSLANIHIIYAIDCSKLFFFCRLKKKTALQYSLVYWIFKVESVVKSILQLKANAIDLKRRWCLQSFVFYHESYKSIPSKKPTLVLFLHKKGCLSSEYLCAINIFCLENALSN